MAFTVEILVLKGAFLSGIAVTFDVLETANRLRERSGLPPAFALRTSGSGAHQLRGLLGDCRAITPAGLIVVPGLGLSREDELTSRLENKDALAAQRVLADAVDRDIEVAGACSAVFLMAASGILNGRRATTTWWLSALFRRLHPEVDLDTEALLVTDGPVTTAGAAMAQLDLALAIVARHASPSLANACARHLVLDDRRSQSPYMALEYLAASDEHVARAESWARAHLAERQSGLVPAPLRGAPKGLPACHRSASSSG